jgi:hypothetical protein
VATQLRLCVAVTNQHTTSVFFALLGVVVWVTHTWSIETNNTTSSFHTYIHTHTHTDKNIATTTTRYTHVRVSDEQKESKSDIFMV